MVSVTGDRELIAKFEALTNRAASRITRKAIGKGAREMRDEIKFQIRATKTPGHSNRGLKASIGSRFKKSRKTNQYEALVGIGVGKKRAVGTQASGPKSRHVVPHFHLLALGTKSRYTGHRIVRTKSGVRKKKTGNPIAYRGRMPGDDFVGRATAARGSKAVGVMLSIMKSEIEKVTQ